MHEVRYPIKMVLTVTEAIGVQRERKLVSIDDLRADSSAIGATATQRLEYTVLSRKLTTRCNKSPFLGVKALHQLIVQRNLDVDPASVLFSTHVSYMNQ